MRELHHRTKMFLCVCDWYRMARRRTRQIFDKPGEHADEMETSLGLAFFPELVNPELADAGAARPTKLRRHQSRLGQHHPALAPGDDEHRHGRPAPPRRRKAGDSWTCWSSGLVSFSSSWRRRLWITSFPTSSYPFLQARSVL